MANTKSAKKATRQIQKRTAVNTARKSRMRSFIRRVEEAIASGEKEEAQAALRAAQPIIARNGQRGVMHERTAARKISRLSKRVGAMESA